MSEDQFMKLFKYIQEFRQEVDEQFKEQKRNFSELVNTVDGYAGKIDLYAQEMAAMDHKMNRLEKYIQILADKAGIDLDRIHV